MVLNFEKEKLVEELKKANPKKVLVQLPEGLKQNALEISEEIQKLGIETIFSGETCWGGCAVATQEAQALEVDLIVHFGHAKFLDTDFPVLYINVRDELDIEPYLQKSLKVLENFTKIGLSYSIQHKHDIEKIKNFYTNNGKSVILSKKIGYVAYEGHIVGCQYGGLKAIQDEVDCFLIIGNQFHSMGAVVAVKKPVILVDVYNDNIKRMDNLREKILKQRFMSIEKFKQAKNIGIIIEIKLGQKFGSPKYLVEKIKEQGKNPIVITMNEITPEKIMNFYNIDAFIELACPRIAIDDFAKYGKPILTFKEALIAFGVIQWEDALKDGIL